MTTDREGERKRVIERKKAREREKERERERESIPPPSTQNIESDLRMMYYQMEARKK